VRIPLVFNLQALSLAAPLVAAAAARRPVPKARAWVLAWSALLLVEGGFDFWFAVHGRHNIWLSYIFSPVAHVLALWALSCWQVSNGARLAMRWAIIPLMAVWLWLILAFEDTSSFSRTADSLAYLVGLCAAAYTLIARSRTASGDLLRADWLWVSAGMALYLATYSMVGPFSALLVGNDPVLLFRAFEFQAVLVIAAFLAVAWGMTCPVSPMPSRPRPAGG
jgi:hypothetical protein